MGGMKGGGGMMGGGPGNLPGVADASSRDSNGMAAQLFSQAAQAAAQGDVAEVMQLVPQAMRVLMAGQSPAGPAAPTPDAMGGGM